MKKTYAQRLIDLYKVFSPKEEGIISYDEISQVVDILELNDMSTFELRNLRDMTVLFFSRKIKNDDSFSVARSIMDKMSAVTCVIDSRIFKLGGEV